MSNNFHAVIVEAPLGELRHEAVRRRAMSAVCEHGGDAPCGVCGGCKKASALAHPDVAVIKPDGAEVKVGQIRAARAELWIKPNEAARRVLIIDNAESMNATAQNALLAVLEQPPSDTVFILAASNADALLPTVRSRCHVIRLANVQQPISKAARQLADAMRRRDAAAAAEALAPLARHSSDAFASELYAVRAALADTFSVDDALERALALLDAAVAPSQVASYIVAALCL